MLGCLVSGAASQGNTYSNPVAYDAPTDFTFNFKSTKLVTLGSTPLVSLAVSAEAALLQL